MTYTVVIHKAEEGGYWAEVPAVPGCFTQGETLDEVLENAREALRGCLDALAAMGKPVEEDVEVRQVAETRVQRPPMNSAMVEAE